MTAELWEERGKVAKKGKGGEGGEDERIFLVTATALGGL